MRDYERDLNARGRAGARVMGRHIREYGQEWDAIVASPATRVRTTLNEALPDAEITWDRRLYLASAETLMDVATEADGDAVLLSGHNPGLGDIILELVSETSENDLFHKAKAKFPTAAFAVLDLDIAEWSDLKPRCGELVHFKRPRDLDPELGPDF